MIYFWCAVKMKFSVRSSIGLRVRERKLQIIVKMNMNVGSSCVFKKCCACEFRKLIYCKIFWSRNRKNLKIEKSVKNSEFEKTFWVNSTQELDTSCPGFFFYSKPSNNQLQKNTFDTNNCVDTRTEITWKPTRCFDCFRFYLRILKFQPVSDNLLIPYRGAEIKNL